MIVGSGAELREGDGEGFGEDDGWRVGIAQQRAKESLHAVEVEVRSIPIVDPCQGPPD